MRVAGTRVTVNQLVTYYKRGLSAEEIGEQYPHLSLAQIYAALAYYHANQAEVEAALQDEAREAEVLHRQFTGTKA